MFNNKNLFVALTYKCNAFCTKCMTRYHKNRNIEISKSIITRLCELLSENDYKGVISVGTGEPLLYSDFYFFLDSIISLNQDVKLRLLTNGMLLSENQNTDIFNDRCIWGVTFDAFNQDSLIGLQKGVILDTVKKNITGICKKYDPSRLYLNYTMYRTNIDEIIPFCRFAIDNGIKEIYLTELKVFTGYESILNPYKVVHDEVFIKTINEAKELLLKNGISTKGINLEKGIERCECFKNNLAFPIIDVDGSVSFCSGREDLYVGNILESDIQEKWKEYKTKVELSNKNWCKQCFDNCMENGIYRLPKTIIRRG